MNLGIFFESYYVGGLDTFTIQLINDWSYQDNITLFCNKSHSGADYLKEKIVNPNCKIEYYTMPTAVDVFQWVYSKTKSKKIGFLAEIISYYLLIPYYILCSYSKLSLNRFDEMISINGGYPACLMSRCVPISRYLYAHKKTIQNFHNFAHDSSVYLASCDWVVDLLLQKSTSRFVSVSQCCSESLRVRSVFSDNTNITYIYNGISDDLVSPSFSLKGKLHVSNDTYVLMMLATYEERKGHNFIIDVFSEVLNELSDVHLVFLGYGTDEEMNCVKKHIIEQGVNDKVSLLGFQNNAMEYLAQTDLLLIGSQDAESFGLTSIEAMKYRKVVLSTNIGGLKEVIEDGNGGFLFSPDDVEGMSNKIVELLNNPDEMKRQENLGYERYQSKFRSSRVSKEYRDLLLENCVNHSF